jgi:leader peptidase (prepilin peptidase) / N-methyltransferase
MGLFLGRSVGPAMLVALVAGSLVGAAIIARKGAQEGRKTAIPFGPYLAFGGIVGLFAGGAIVEWYLNTFT